MMMPSLDESAKEVNQCYVNFSELRHQLHQIYNFIIRYFYIQVSIATAFTVSIVTLLG